MSGDPTENRRPGPKPAYLLAAMFAGWLAIALYAVGTKVADGWASASVGVMASAAAALVGGLLGFLFGIPRTLQAGVQVEKLRSGERPADAPGIDPKQRYEPNTNLEQISDWLTKILVGVSLTQIPRISQELNKLTLAIGQGMGGGQGGQAFGAGIIVFYSVAGFLLGYLWTRLYMPNALTRADRSVVEAMAQAAAASQEAKEAKGLAQSVQDSVAEQNRRDAQALTNVQYHLEPPVGAPPIAAEEVKAAIQSASPAVQAQIFEMARAFRKSAAAAKEYAKIARVRPIFEALVETDIAQKQHRYRGQLAYTLAASGASPADLQRAEEALTEAIQIRGSPAKGWLLYEFNRAQYRIQRDPGFNTNQTSDADTTTRIVEDLTVARSDPYLKTAIEKDDRIQKWLVLNKITL